MKKFVFYIPAILFTILFGWLSITFGIKSTSPIVLVWIALFLVGSFILNKGRFWGGFLGVLPGIHWIYMSTQETGQPINIEFPIGISVVIFYMLCIVYVYRKNEATA